MAHKFSFNDNLFNNIKTGGETESNKLTKTVTCGGVHGTIGIGSIVVNDLE